MGWKKTKSEVNSRPVFDVEIPELDFSLDSVFAELKTELKESGYTSPKKVRKRKSKPKIAENVQVAEEKKVRTLSAVEDIANKIGMDGYLIDLRRTKIGNLNVQDALSLDKIEAL